MNSARALSHSGLDAGASHRFVILLGLGTVLKVFWGMKTCLGPIPKGCTCKKNPEAKRDCFRVPLVFTRIGLDPDG